MTFFRKVLLLFVFGCLSHQDDAFSMMAPCRVRKFVNSLRSSGSNMGVFKLPGDVFGEEEGKDNAVTEFITDDEKNVDATIGNRSGGKEVLRQMVMAFDNLPEEEVEYMFNKLTCENEVTRNERSDIMFKLVDLTKRANEVEKYVGDTRYNYDELADAIRSIRSEIRMYAKDLDFYDQNGNKQKLVSPFERAVNDLKFPWQ